MGYVSNKARELGGTPERTRQSVGIASAWWIPNGSDYDRAEMVWAFFETKEAGEAFEKAFSYPPECGSFRMFEEAEQVAVVLDAKKVKKFFDRYPKPRSHLDTCDKSYNRLGEKFVGFMELEAPEGNVFFKNLLKIMQETTSMYSLKSLIQFNFVCV